MHKGIILAALKPKVKAFGFNTKEIEGIAESISNNLNLADDASDEDVNEAIEKSINAVLPVFTQAQSMANRVIEKKSKEMAAQLNNNTGGEGNGNDNNGNQGNGNQENGAGNNNDNNGVDNKGGNDNGKALAEMLAEALKPFTAKIDALSGELTAMKTEKTTTSRKQRLEKLLENSGAYGQRTLKNFAKMSFENDDEFNEFLSDVESDLKAYNQERADAGLQQLGVPPSQNHPKDKPYAKPLTEQEIKDLVDSL